MLLKRRFFTSFAGIIVIIITWTFLRRGSDSTYSPDLFEGAGLHGNDATTPHSVSFKETEKYIKAILNPSDTSFDRLECTGPNAARYSYLNPTISSDREVGKKKYFFALILHQSIHVIPRLLGSVIEAVRLLGPENCELSIVEGRSDDGTYEVLYELKKSLEEMGLKYHFQKNDLDTSVGERIQKLADLRNLALEPLMVKDAKNHFSNLSTVIFINDVAACPDDILELIHQREYQSADMTCAMDWAHSGPEPALFYDIWISRGITGDTFWRVGQFGGWEYAKFLFWNDDLAKLRLDAFKPFQVFACWNGATAFTAAPFIEGQIKFRSNVDGECFMGEPTLFCKDMWRFGYGKIAVVPSINLQYTDETARRIKHEEKGYVHDLIKNENSTDGGSLKINWQREPPELIKCMPSFNEQSWKPWNEGFTGKDLKR